jgi:hypothetical protein
MIRTLATSIALALALAAPGYAQDKKEADKAPSKAQKAQQARMKSCNEQAEKKDLKGRERQSFMSECLSTKGKSKGDGKLTAQQQRMKTCNAQASKKGMKGDARKDFMSECLKDKS